MSHRIPISEFIVRLREEGLLTMWQGDPDLVIEDIQYDSRKCTANSLFLCKGATFQPSYITKAAEAGAVAYLAVRPFDEGEDLTALIVSDIRRALAVAADVFFESPWKKLHMIGVTGTKGKSTTVTLLKDILDADAREKGLPLCGLTSSTRIYDGKIDAPAQLTTPENIDLYRYLDDAVENGLARMIVEVSSQALKYHRVGGIHFDDGVFLNIAPDHISDIEHPDFEDYFSSKLLLFKVTRHAYINPNSDRFADIQRAAAQCEQVTTFAVEGEAQYRAEHIESDKEGMAFDLHAAGETHHLTTAMKGIFNVENALAAATVALNLGVSVETIARVLAQVHFAGHMIYRHSQDGVTAIIDYAHNDISFRKVIETVHVEYPGAPLWFVFGAPGSKAQSRRSDLGRIVSQEGARVYLVPDDPAKEQVLDINAEIISHFTKETPVVSLDDRAAGIRDALLSAPAGTVVLILGKGSETAQKGPNGPEPYTGDLPLAEAAISARDKDGAQASVYFCEPR